MKTKSPVIHFIFLGATAVVVLGYFALTGNRSRTLAIGIGAGLPACLGVAGTYFVLWSLKKPTKTFLWAVLGGGLLRIVVLLAVIWLAFHVSKTQFVSFVIATLASYAVFLFAEVVVLARMRTNPSPMRAVECESSLS